MKTLIHPLSLRPFRLAQLLLLPVFNTLQTLKTIYFNKHKADNQTIILKNNKIPVYYSKKKNIFNVKIINN